MTEQRHRTQSISDEVKSFEENCPSPQMVEILRSKTPEERLEVAFGMWTSTRDIVSAAVTQQHPDWSETQINREIAKRMSHGRV
jgi:hypothetical protein